MDIELLVISCEGKKMYTLDTLVKKKGKIALISPVKMSLDDTCSSSRF